MEWFLVHPHKEMLLHFHQHQSGKAKKSTDRGERKLKLQKYFCLAQFYSARPPSIILMWKVKKFYVLHFTSRFTCKHEMFKIKVGEPNHL